MLSHDLIDVIGRTPLVRLRLGADRGVEVYAKCEALGPGGPGARAARLAVAAARPADHVPVVVSGAWAPAVALVAGRLGHPVHVVDDGVARPALTALGCLPTAEPPTLTPDAVSQDELAAELAEDLDWIDVVVGGDDDLRATAGALRAHLPGVRVVGVRGSLPRNGSPFDELYRLNEHEAFEATRNLALDEKLFAGPVSGAVYRVLGELAAKAAPGTRIVGVFPDRGEDCVETVYSDEYWARHRIAELPLSTMSAARPDEALRVVFVESSDVIVPAALGLTPTHVRTCADPIALRRTVLRACGADKIVGVLSTDHAHQAVAARLAADLGVPGPSAGFGVEQVGRDRQILPAESNGTVASRAVLSRLFRLTTGTELVQAELRALAGAGDPSFDGVAGVHFLRAQGILDEVTGVDLALAVPGVEEVAVTTPTGDRIGDHVGYVIAWAATRAELLDRLDQAAAHLHVRLRPARVPYPLVSREAMVNRSVVTVGGVEIGPDTFTLIAGPCAVETVEQTFTSARMALAAGATLLRGGAFKPRSSPYGFRGLREDGLRILADVRAETGLPIVTEVVDSPDVDLVARYADMLQIGTRNMQNFGLLEAAADSGRPILLKRGMSATVQEWLLAAEYIAVRGNNNIVLCERGIRTFEPSTRNTLDLSAVLVAQGLSHLPVIVDPSHASGLRELVLPLARAAVAVGADGVMLDVHPEPEKALCDAKQALDEAALDGLAEAMRDWATLAGRLSPDVLRQVAPAGQAR
ncbi:3-deoxy-7-phosphoheptulonate synthase [Kutzneria sp. NPDC051319]|uniref:3-deoxy-7-phosphoheptulonate synthase n=1 Tax=Kutzneria sp. NPDC051319 TaxID=3155047 RepID=UPI00343BE49A